MFNNTRAKHIRFLFLHKGDINSSYKYFMYMLGLRTQWRAGTASTCRTQPFVRFSYHATERVHRGRFLPRRSSRAPARLTQQHQSFLQHVELFRDDSLAVGTYNKASTPVMIYERNAMKAKRHFKDSATYDSVLQTRVNGSRCLAWKT